MLDNHFCKGAVQHGIGLCHMDPCATCPLKDAKVEWKNTATPPDAIGTGGRSNLPTQCLECGYVAVPPVCTQCGTPFYSEPVGAVDEVRAHWLGKSPLDMANEILRLREQVAALTKERDSANACFDAHDELLHQCLADREYWRTKALACGEEYWELLGEVEIVTPNETRHESALRLIRAAKQMLSGGPHALTGGRDAQG